MEKPKITDCIFRVAKCYPHDPAIYISTEEYIDYHQLSITITDLANQLYEKGVCKNSRLAIILPNSAEALISFYAVTFRAIAVPLNPQYSQAELRNYLTITRAQAIITNQDIFARLQPTAEELQLPVFKIKQDKNKFAFIHSNEHLLSEKIKIDFATNIAAILLTSGTTAVSKVVPLTHDNLIIPAEIKKKAFKVQRTDRAINIIPLFHIYGITGSVLVAAAAGGSIICMPEFNAAAFFEILKKLQINWYAAGPTVHSAVAEYAKKTKAKPQDYALRVIRSGGAALPLDTVLALETHFSAVVLSGYGLTETGGLGATNLVPPSKIKANSVGLGVGIEIKIVDATKKMLPAHQIGQIIVRGPSLTTGYENQKNSSSFWNDGWFATGDLGYMDDDGYLFIAGRINDTINKGGYKISPYEVEMVFLMHPDIVEAVVYPAPHPSLGELPMAIVVLSIDSVVTESMLKLFLQKKLSISKIPARIIGAKQIPKNNTGKIMRASMHQYVQKHPHEFSKLNEKNDVTVQDAELIQIENELSNIWKKILKIDSIGNDDNYFTLGGDSLSVVFLFLEIEQQFNITLPVECILTKGTIRDMATLIYQKERKSTAFEFIVPLHLSKSKKTPIFCLHALIGDAFTYRKLTEHLGEEYSVYGLVFNPHSSQIRHPVQLTQLASIYIREIRKVQPKGPYCLLGYSLGGAIAYEVARQLRLQCQEIAMLALLDTRFEFTEQLVQKTFAALKNKMLQEIKVFHKTSGQLKNEFAIAKMLKYAFTHYELAAYDGTVLYFYAELADNTYAERSLKQFKHFAKNVEIINIHSKHASLISEPAIIDIAQYLKIATRNLENCETFFDV